MSKCYDERAAKHIRYYDKNHCIVFCKTKEEFGGLSNMAAGFPICVNGVPIRTSEALYQMCRYPNIPELQEKIINQKSPMTAKMVAKPYRTQTRSDWDDIRIRVMRWCLRVKLAQNWDIFSSLILSTNDLPIVEHSKKDMFWGAKLEKEGDLLVGMNILGRLLMELRQEILSGPRAELLQVEPPQIKDFLIFGENVHVITGKEMPDNKMEQSTPNVAIQLSLFPT